MLSLRQSVTSLIERKTYLNNMRAIFVYLLVAMACAMIKEAVSINIGNKFSIFCR